MKLRSTPLRVRLVAALILPVLVVAGYLALRVDGAFDARQVASRQEAEVARFSTVSALSQAVAAEQTNLVNTLTGDAETAAARARTDAAVVEVRSAGLAPAQLEQIEQLIGEIAGIRELVGTDVADFRIRAATEVASGNDDEGSAVSGALRLSAIAKQIVFGYDFETDAVADVETARGLNDVALIQSVRSNFAAETNVALGLSTIDASARTAAAIEFFSEAQANTTAALDDLSNRATPELQRDAAAYFATPAYQEIDDLRVALDAVEPFGDLPVGSLDLVAAGVAADTALGSVEASLTDDLVTNASDSKASAQWDLVRSAGVGAGLFLLVVLILIALYRSIRNPLGRLTERSQEIADVELPEIVTRMRQGDIEEIPTIEPLVADTNDEVGALVHAFNGMHRTAVELASEQAASRRVVADMFVNLGRRNQRLLNRMLKGLTMLERNEPDPDTLAALYDIDHLATRMRRNAESLLILAGASQARRWKNPVNAYDIVRASLAEVEGYDRVVIDAPEDAMVHPDLVADLTHLLAELVENALSFSPANTTVNVVTRPTNRGFMFVVIDEGLGMTPELLRAANERIAAAASEDETPSEFLGHYVVGRLAVRHGIEVELLEGVTGGLTARVILPNGAIVAKPDAAAATETAGHNAMTAIEAADSTVANTDTALRPSMDWNSYDLVSQTSERPLAAPTPHLGLPESLVVPPSPAALDDVDQPSFLETDVALMPLDDLAGTETASVPAEADTEAEADSDATSPAGADTHVDADTHDNTSATSTLIESLTDSTDNAVANLTVFGSQRRTPGAQSPITLGSTTVAVDESSPNHDDADSIRSSLSSFQTATVRADGED